MGKELQIGELKETMERLTVKRKDGRWSLRNDDGETPLEQMNKIPRAIDRLAAYEDAMPLERVQELAQAEKDGRLVVLPCKSDTVYTIEEDYFNCDECRNRSRAHFQPKINRVSCDMDKGTHCPFYIKEHEAGGFEVMFDKTGVPALSNPGEFGYEGLEQFSGIDSKVYYTREEAEAELKKREAENETN